MLYWGGLLLAACTTVLLAWTAAQRWRSARRWTRRDGRAESAHRYCPGGARGLWRFVDGMWPWRWFIRSGCGYDLSGHLAASPYSVRCPECGTQSPARRLMRRRRQVRWTPVAIVLMAGSITMVGFDPPGARRVAARMPTEALLWMEIGLTHRNHLQFRRELMRRANDGRLSARQEGWLIPRLIDDLHDDDRDYNANTAEELLSSFWPRSERALRDAMESDDWQQRQLAATVVRRHTAHPDELLLRVTIDGLRSIHGLSWWYRYPNVHDGTASGRFEYLVHWYNQARPFIIEALDSDSSQLRLVCAGIAAVAGDDELMEPCAAILIEHLRDNQSRRDAIFAARALYAYGPGVVPLLERALGSDDQQQRQIAEHLIFELLPGLALEFPAPVAPKLSDWMNPLDVRSDYLPTPRVE